MSSQHTSKAAAWLNHQVEKEGIARLTIIILLLTTVAMLAYTWGYAEGVHNSQSELAQNIRLNTGEKMPSIAELRHGSSTHEQQGPEAGTQHGSGLAPQPLAQAANTTSSFDVKQDDIAAGSVTVPLPAGSSSDNGGTDTDSSTGSTHSTVQGQETASDSSSSHTDSGSTGDGSGSSILQPHSRAGDGSEDDDLLLDTAASFEEYDEVPV